MHPALAEWSALSLEREHQHERVVDSAEFACVQAAGRSAETLRVDDCRLLDEHSRLAVLEMYGRAKGRWPCTGRCWCNQHRAEIEKLVCLDNDRVARPTLLMPSDSTRSGKTEDLAAHHVRKKTKARGLPSVLG
jgi:hypothetical protein